MTELDKKKKVLLGQLATFKEKTFLKVEEALAGKQDTIADLATIRSGAALGATSIQSHQDISGKVDKVTGKGLSTNDFTDSLKSKLDNIAAGAEVNVQSDWNQTDTSADDYIKNKPTIPTVPTNVSAFTNDAGYLTSHQSLSDYVKESDLVAGEVVPALADNLTSWEEDYSEVRNSWDETIRTTAGDDPIVTKYGGVLQSITAVEDFSCTSFTTTPYNQLRLASNGGAAVALGDSAWYFPVPKLTLGEFGDATENNGILFTDSEGNNLQPTVRFVPLANGEPTSASAGTVISPTTVVYNGKTYKVYTTSGAGYLIVSGITQASTCAHIAWEDWYDRYVSPTDAEDMGTTINLAPLFTAAPNGSGKFLVLGNAGNIVATKAERTDETHIMITDPIGRTAVTAASWTDTQNAAVEGEETTYTHSCTVSGMKSGGLAAIEGSNVELDIDGTTVSYTDENATGMACTIRYEKATPATATVTLAKTSYDLDDCGLEIKNGVIGSAYFECSYSQNVADALSQIAKVRFNVVLSVLAEAIASLHNEVKVLKDIVLTASYKTMDAEDYTCMGNPVVLTGTSAPSVTPKFVGQFYIDTTNSKVYIAKAVTNATGNWVILN